MSFSSEQYAPWLKSALGANTVELGERVQSLWSGYGEIRRIHLSGVKVDGKPVETAILKAINFPDEVSHPRGWHSDFSHQRKVRSYEVEMHWYREWAQHCGEQARVARCLTSETLANGALILLEDLDAAGFPERRDELTIEGLKACLEWLAAFHGRFVNQQPTGLWEEGSYWHLDTRPDEWSVMDDGPLKEAAAVIDQRLKNAAFSTLVHGDAKVANFCFSEKGNVVAAVDFQYVGGGCGMKDVAYFLGSCLDEQGLLTHEAECLESYFSVLREHLAATIDAGALEAEWRSLYPLAWADFHRFLAGWMPTHHKINPVMQRWTDQALAGL